MEFDVWKQSKLMNGLDKLKTASLPEQSIASLDEMKRLAGISSAPSAGQNMSLSGSQKSQLMREHNIKPGTSEWFKLWFARPDITGERSLDK